MKKLLIVVLALCLIFALATTVYAAVGIGDPTPFATTEGVTSGNTTVNLEVSAVNLSVTVPINMTVAVPTNGGTVACPDNYAIVNKSYFPIYVTGITASTPAEGWDLLTSTIAAGAVPTGSVGDLYMVLDPATGTDWVVLDDTGTSYADADDWVLAAATSATGTAFAIGVSATSSALKTTTGQTAVFSITYTVSATNPNP